MRRGSTGFALWSWPWEIAQANLAIWETAMAAPMVIGARLPLIRAAFVNPWTGDYQELSGMVTEKWDAFGVSGRSVSTAARRLKAVGDAQARDLGRISAGAFFGPGDFMRMAQRNLDMFATLVALPGEAVAPIHRKATANARRLRG